MAQVERMTLEMDVIAKVDGAIGGINKIKSTLQGIKMPPKLGADLEKSFSNLSGLFEKYKDQVKNGFNTKGDVSSFAKTAKQIDNEVDRLSKNLHKLTGEKITLNIETDRLKSAQNELTKLIAQKEKLMSDVKGSFGLGEYFDAFRKVSGGRNTKVFGAANILQTSLERGNLTKALEDIKALEAAYNKMKDTKQAAFQDKTGVTGSAAITQLRNKVEEAIRSQTTYNQKIETTRQELENIPTQMMNDAGKLAEQAAQGMDKLASETKQVTASSTEAARATQSMSQQLQDLQHSTQYFFSLRNMINLFRRGVQDAVQSVKELDAAMTDTAVVTDYKVSDLWGMLPEYTQIANELGATTQGAYETMTLYFQQGLDQQQAFEIGAETMKMARIAGLEYAEATDMMTAALRGFNMELNETSAQRINDVYSKLAAVTASDTEELGTAMQRTASIAHSAGMSFEGTTAFLAQAIETTREPAENLGTAMKTIVARFQEMKKNPLEMVEVDGEEVSYNKVDEALQSIGVSLKDTNGQFRELDQVFLDISKRWDGLSQTQQRYIATIAAGSRQQSRFIAMMSNYGRTVELMEAANNSAGASEEQFGKTMDSLEAKLNRLHNAWQQFTMGIANNGMIKLAVDGTTSLLNVVNKLIDKFSLGIGPVKSLLSLLTAFTGLKMAGRFANSLIGGLGGLIDPQSGFLQGFKGGAIGSRTTVNSAQAQAISNPIVQAIHQLQSALTGKLVTNNAQTATNNTNLASGALFKQVNEGIRKALSTDKLTGSGLMNQLSGLDKTSQRLMMANLTGTQRNLNQNLLGQYGDSIFKKSMPAIQTAFKRIDQKVANESIAFTEGYAAKVSPKALLQHLDMNNADERALAQSISTGLNNARQQALEDAVKTRGKQNNIDYSDPKLLAKAVKAFAGTDEGKKVASGAEEKFILDPKIIRTPMQQAMDDLGKFGSGLTGAGMAITSFGSILTSTGIPGVQELGMVISKLGGGITAFGTLLSGATAAIATFTDSTIAASVKNFISNPVTIAVAAVAAALIGLVAVIKAHNKKIRDEAEQVTIKYNDKTSKAKENINNLKQYREELTTLSKGVDKNGLNVSLDTADYERYRDIVNSIAEINPSIVQGYNAQGDAIIDNNNALEETLRLQEEINQKATEEYTNSYSLDKLIKARDLDEAFFDPTSKKTGQDSDPARQAAKHLISVFKKSHVQDEFLEQFGLSYDQLAKDENNAISRFIANHDVMIKSLQNRYRATGRELNSSLVEGFGNLSEAYDAQQEAIKPIYDNLLAYASNKQLTKGFEPEMISAFNQGLKTIAGSKGDGSQMQGAVDEYAKLMNNLIGKNSEYNKVMKEVTDLQNDWTDSLDDDTYLKAAQEKADALTELANKEREAAKSAKDMTEAEREAHRVMADFYDNSAAKVLSFTNKSIQDLTSTFNEFSESIRNAGKAYEDYQKRIEGLDNYGTGVNSFKQIYDDIFKETEDSSGRKQQLNIEGIGRPEAWEAAKSFFTSDWLSGKSIDEVVKGLKKIGPLLEEGQKGAIAFGDKIRDSLLNNKGFKKRFGEVFSLNPDGSVNIAENLAPEMMEHIARYWGIQEDLLVAWFDNARQYMPEFSFGSSNEDIRNALAKDSRTYHGPEEAAGDKDALFVRRDTLVEAFEAGGTYAQDVIDSRITELGSEQSVYAIPELNKDLKLSKEDKDYMTNTMGINKDNFVDSLAPLLTGEEMEQYAGQIFENGEQWWKETGEGLYDTWSANQEALIDDLTPQEDNELPSIASSVSNIEAMMTTDLYRSGQMEDTSSLDQMHRAIFGNEGWDTSIQKLKHGESLDISKEEFEQYYADAINTVSTLSKVEEDLNAGRLQAIQDYGAGSERVKRYDEAIQQVSSDLSYAQGAIDEANKYRETKTWQYDDSSIQQHVNDVVSAGWGQLLSGISVETLATPEAQQAMETIASHTFTPDMIPTEELTNAWSILGIEWNQAALSGMETWNNTETANAISEKITEAGNLVTDGIQTGLQGGIEQKGEELGQAGEEVGSSMLNKIDTSWITNLASGIVQKYEESVNNNPINIPNIAPTVNQGAEAVSGIAQQAVAATLTVDTSDSDAKLDATQQKTSEVADIINQGATFTILTPGITDLTDAANAAQKVTDNVGAKSISLSTSISGASAENIDTLKTSINGFNNLNNHKVTLTTSLKGASVSSIEDIIAAINAFHLKTSHTVNLITNKITNNKENNDAAGQHNHGYASSPSFGSAARGSYGQIGPKGKGGLTLTGELGYEIAWLPSENRSIILGANGPQMLNLPGDAVVWNHEQSKKILKQKAISAGSMWGGGSLKTSDPDGSEGSNKKKKKKKKKKGKKSKSKSKSKSSSKDPTLNLFSIQEVVRFNIDQAISDLNADIEKREKEIEKGLSKIGASYKSISGVTKKQISALKQIQTRNQQLLASYQAQLKEYRGQEAYVKWTTNSGESKNKKIKIKDYLNEDGSINQAAISALGSRAEREAVFKEVSSAKSLVDGIQKARDEIDKAGDQIEELGKKITEQFFLWENELTKIYNLTQKINNLNSLSERFASQIALETAKLGAGFGDLAQSIDTIRKVTVRNNETIGKQIALQQQMISARQEEMENILTAVNEVKDLEAARADKISDADTKQQRIKGADENYKVAKLTYGYLKNLKQDLDGNISYDIDWAQIAKDRASGDLNNDTYERVKDHLDKLGDSVAEFNDSIKTQTDTLAELYDQYRQYQDTISDFGGTLLDSLETIQKEREDELKKMSTLISAIGDNMKDLLDQVKRNLEERRKQEDNRKTESDISKKQQRLAALQADTSGGHQVEIAQLQKEIGDAQQNYQRTLEDQLLDRLQTQNDEAIKQRERMISLSEAQLAIATQNNTELVNLWLKDPEAYKSKIYDAYLEAINISEKLDIDQQLAKQDFNSKFASVVTAVDQIEIPNNLNALTQINSSITNLQGILTQQNTSKTSAQAQVTAKNTTSTATKPAASTTTPKVATPAAPKAAAKTTATTTAKTTVNKDADIWTKVKNTFKNLSIDAASGKQAALGADALRVAKTHKGEKVYIGNQDAHVGASGEIYWDRKGEVRKWNPSTGEIKKFKYNKNAYIKEANPKQSPYVYEEFRESLHTHKVKGYKTGGLASETGPAYLHGTPSKPELVLNAQDTKNFIALKDVLSKAVHSSNFASTSYGDATYEININVDKISSDYDVDKMAERVKKIIVSDSSYRNVTQVRKFR